MPKFRKLPVVVEAILYDWDDNEKCADEAQDDVCDFMKANIVIDSDDDIEMEAPNGCTVYATKGDYIIQGIAGEFYPCKPDIFTKTYEQVGGDCPIEEGDEFDFGSAIYLLKMGKKVARAGWNGKGMYVYYVPAASYPVERNNLETMGGEFENDMVPYREYLALKTAQGDVATWSPSVSDALATDWCLA